VTRQFGRELERRSEGQQERGASRLKERGRQPAIRRRQHTAKSVTRRTVWQLLTGGLALCLISGEGRANAQTGAPKRLSVAEAAVLAERGDVVLVDIRTRGEWRRSGIAAPAIALTMHQPRGRFIRQLAAALSNVRSRPVALICATGGRTAYMQRELAKEGFTNVTDVGAGMFGSAHGRGWLSAGLPVRQPTPQEIKRATARTN